MPVVVVVRLDDIEAAEFAGETGLAGAIAKGAVSVVVKEVS